MSDYHKKRQDFIDLEISAANVLSPIWKELKNDFNHPSKSSLRGYGLSFFSSARINSYKKTASILKLLFRLIKSLIIRIENFVLMFLSYIHFNFDSKAARKYGYDKYDIEVYDQSLLNRFSEKFNPYGIGFSHNTLKSFSYLEKLSKHFAFENKSKPVNILEIGAGVFNFGHLISFELKNFSYVVCDLPEMVVTAHYEITSKYLNNDEYSYKVFLPNEINEFTDDKSQRKLLFITPDQLNDLNKLGIKFDIFINHESFAEMKIETVNNYLEQVNQLLAENGLVNIVNRHSRPQAKGKSFIGLGVKDLTSFSDYNLAFCETLEFDIDPFRSRLPEQQNTPNIFFVGRKK